MISSKTASIRVALCATALLAVAGCRETTTCADNPSPVCPDAAGPAMDGGPPDAFRRPDANLDAPGLDAFEVVPDAWTPDDAWAPDAGSDAGPCSRCPAATPACFMDTCVECASNADCVGAAGGPACDLDTHTCVACTVGTDCTAPLAACLPDTNTCVRCDDRPDCAAPTPACVANNCVQCENRSDCSGGTPACVGNACVQCDSRSDCSGGTPACFGNACVQCEANTDCTSVSASRCNVGAHACAACMGDSDCSHLGATPVCDEGRGVCVQCTGDTEAARCGANSCRRSDGTCTTTMRATVDVCEACNADSECLAGQHCVRQMFGGTDVGSYCLLDAVGGCGNTVLALRPYSNPTSTVSLDGVTGTFCFPPTTTTCEGVLDTRSQACSMSSDCGSAGSDDGYCPPSGTGAGLCSYRCTGAVDCLDGLNCGSAPAHCRP